jgi:DNA-directed RNA polymerase II subunit RPB2
MLHSRYCILNRKPAEFLQEAGECPYDQGGYFIVDGSEKVLIAQERINNKRRN